MYYVILDPGIHRQDVLDDLQSQGILAVFHYIPLHSSPAGLRYGRTADGMGVTNSIAERLIRLPLWLGISIEQQTRVVETLSDSVRHNARSTSHVKSVRHRGKCE